jgi:hypothetical protein
VPEALSDAGLARKEGRAYVMLVIFLLKKKEYYCEPPKKKRTYSGVDYL